MNRETLKRRLKALRDRTVARGCTEAEAMAAAEKMAELMREHAVSPDELDMGEAAAHTKWALKPAAARLWGMIATCTNTAVLFAAKAKGRDVIFYGREPGPEIAVYLFDVCENAVRNETARFRAGEFYKRRRSAKTKRLAVEDFQTGLIGRLNNRLLQLFGETLDKRAQAKALAYRDRLSPDAKSLSFKTPKNPRFESAVLEGWAAGGRVHLSHGMASNASAKEIGGSR